MLLKTSIASLALATALGLGFAAGAQAQVVTSNPTGTYSVNIVASAPAGFDVAGGQPLLAGYNYTYMATLTATSPGVSVNSFQLGSVFDYDPLSVNAVGGGFSNSSETGNAIGFTSNTGLTTIGQSATFSYFSTFQPTGKINITPSATAPNGTGAGIGNAFIGPGPNAPKVPEADSFALLGLGLLPLAMIARRRLASKN